VLVELVNLQRGFVSTIHLTNITLEERYLQMHNLIMSFQAFFVERFELALVTFKYYPLLMCILLVGSHVGKSLEWLLTNLTGEGQFASVTFEVVH
jgi:hypothetical protein